MKDKLKYWLCSRVKPAGFSCHFHSECTALWLICDAFLKSNIKIHSCVTVHVWTFECMTKKPISQLKIWKVDLVYCPRTWDDQWMFPMTRLFCAMCEGEKTFLRRNGNVWLYGIPWTPTCHKMWTWEEIDIHSLFLRLGLSLMHSLTLWVISIPKRSCKLYSSNTQHTCVKHFPTC